MAQHGATGARSAQSTIREVMTPMPVTLPLSASVVEAAQVMRDEGIGDVLIVDGDRLAGLVTDRDLVVRCLAESPDLSRATVDQACTSDVTCLGPDSLIEDAVQLMRQQAIRRLPVVEDGRPIGIVSLGDLAVERDPGSVLADISAAPETE